MRRRRRSGERALGSSTGAGSTVTRDGVHGGRPGAAVDQEAARRRRQCTRPAYRSRYLCGLDNIQSTVTCKAVSNARGPSTPTDELSFSYRQCEDIQRAGLERPLLHHRTAESDAMQPDDPRRSPPQTAAASDATVLVDRSSAIRGHTGPGPGTVYDPRPDGTGGRSHAQPGAVAGAHVSVTSGDEERLRRDELLRCLETVTVWRNTTSRPLSPCASQGHSDRAARRPLPTPPHRRPPPPFAARSRRPGGVRFRWLPLACPADVG